MKEKFNIDDKYLKQNPYTVPDGYFSSLQSVISDRISGKKPKLSLWTIVRPQLLLATSFAIVFMIAYTAINLFTPQNIDPSSTINDSFLVDDLHINSNFIDFYDSESDSLYIEEEDSDIDPEEIVNYLTKNTRIIYLASME